MVLLDAPPVVAVTMPKSCLPWQMEYCLQSQRGDTEGTGPTGQVSSASRLKRIFSSGPEPAKSRDQKEYQYTTITMVSQQELAMIDLTRISCRVDDGAEDLTEALDMARTALANGINIIAATPHFSKYPIGKEFRL